VLVRRTGAGKPWRSVATYFGSSFGEPADQTDRPLTEIVVTHRGSRRMV
jgi:hypothetical protein